MSRRSLVLGLLLLPFAPALRAVAGEPRPEPEPDRARAGRDFEPLDVPAEAWKPLVSAAAWGVLFHENTERAGSSPLEHEKRAGTYLCAACYLPLFHARDKFDSHTGWPSFTRAIAGHVETKRDFKLIVPRTEYHCARCGGHQGHVFGDGPPPTGQRYCNNGVALHFVPESQALPELREPAS